MLFISLNSPFMCVVHLFLDPLIFSSVILKFLPDISNIWGSIGVCLFLDLFLKNGTIIFMLFFFKCYIFDWMGNILYKQQQRLSSVVFILWNEHAASLLRSLLWVIESVWSVIGPGIFVVLVSISTPLSWKAYNFMYRLGHFWAS